MRFVATAFVPIAWLITASAAMACSCIPYGSAAEHVAATPFIFKGRVTGITRGEYEAVTRFQVLEVLKGEAGRTVRISHQISDASCGVTFRRGTTALVFANRGRNGAWSTSLCSAARFSDAEYRRAVRTQPPPASGRKGAVASRSFRVVQINGRATSPPVGRGNRYEVYVHRTGLSASLGCRTVAVPGAIVDGLFRPSAPQHGGLFTGGAPCGIPVDKHWEPKLEQALLSGRVRISEHGNVLTIQAPDIIIRAAR